MLYREIIAVCSEIHTKHINTLGGQIGEFVNVEPGGTHSDHMVLEGSDYDWQTEQILFQIKQFNSLS
jgi:hypothetical protein